MKVFQKNRHRAACRGGFTLIEMLVAVTLVTLMMTLFATVFQVATGLMAKQKGIAENDQRSRMLVTLLRSDLENRITREVAPWGANESTVAATSNLTNRQGYFGYSENATGNDADDVLYFIGRIELGSDDIYFGKARALADGVGNTTARNQPENDDGRIDANDASSSRYAEIVYFLRNGILYRRVMLIRDVADGTPRDASAVALVTTPYEAGGATRNLWTDFDYSVHFDQVTNRPAFHGRAELGNEVGDLATNVASLGIPHFRFGFNHVDGLPREFIGTTFIGRYLQQETSSPSFGYPGRVTAGNPNPMSSGTGRTINANGLVTEYADGTRVSEDVLLSNVHAFDVKIWDPAASTGPDGQPGKTGVDDDSDGTIDNNSELGWPGTDDGSFVDVGHTGTTGFYRSAVNANTTFGNSFDTWHPNVDLPNGGAVQDPPPFRPPTNTTTNFARNPLRAIQIKIRFFDDTSGQLREVTIVQSLLP